MALLTRKTARTWQVASAEAGGMMAGGLTVPQIAKILGFTPEYVADLVNLYYGWKRFPQLLEMPKFHLAKTYLRELKRDAKTKALKNKDRSELE